MAMAQPAPVALDAKLPVRLAVGSLGLADDEQNQKLGDLLTAELSGAPGLELVERQALDKVLGELHLGRSGLVRANDAVRAGKLVRADWFLLGSPVTLEGKHHIVVRVVDARTGILRDAGVFQSDQSITKLTPAVANFLRQCRQNAAAAKSRIYLSVSGFEDLSLNSRRAELPKELRAYLIAAFQKDPNITLLEREFADVLLSELHLDLAGLTEQSATNQPAPMASAYWMVDGSYQSYETTEFEVELKLQVSRMLGRSEWVEMREKPGTALFEKIKSSIDAVIRTNQAALTPTRLTEITAQLSKGQELAPFYALSRLTHSDDDALFWIPRGWQWDQGGMARLRRNTYEAIKAFETVLLLDPDNRHAQMCLAACFRYDYIGRDADARDIYRHLIDSPIKDKWTLLAQKALQYTQNWPSQEEEQRWFESAAAGTTNPDAITFYQDRARRAAAEVTIRRSVGPDVASLAETRMFEKIKERRTSVETVMSEYARVFRADPALAARQLNDLYPKIKERIPAAAPIYLAALVTFQVDTNSPVITDFERTLEWLTEHPEQAASRPDGFGEFFTYVRHGPHDWAVDHNLLPLAVKILESVFRVATVVPKRGLPPVDPHDRIELAFHYMALDRWQPALTIFESYTNQPLVMTREGPWGEFGTVVLPHEHVRECREKLGLPVMVDPHQFEFGEAWYHLHRPQLRTIFQMRNERGLFSVVSDGVWIALNQHLVHVDFQLRTNLITRLPTAAAGTISALSVDSNRVWIGTTGGGLFELEKSTGKFQQFTEKDGLLVNSITSLQRDDTTLWIGYGQQSDSLLGHVGGLGNLNLATHRFTSFTASVLGASPAARPPRKSVTAIQNQPAGDVWYLADSTVARYQPAQNTWETLPNENGAVLRAFVAAGDRLIRAFEIQQAEFTLAGRIVNGVSNSVPSQVLVLPVPEQAQLEATIKTNGSGLRVAFTRSGSIPSRGGLELHSLRDGQRRKLIKGEGLLREPTALALDGENLWVGGAGYVALVDLREDKIKRIAYLHAPSVDRIQIAHGYVWAQFDKHLYRARLQDLY